MNRLALRKFGQERTRNPLLLLREIQYGQGAFTVVSFCHISMTVRRVGNAIFFN